ncbi:hypothetical protein VC870_07625, partial [Citrobacter freundii]|nr:hypothetical protein [Citrobacter freundii]
WLMMSLWDALRMNMMISYQELVRTFPNPKLPKRISGISSKGERILDFPCREQIGYSDGVQICAIIPSMKNLSAIVTYALSAHGTEWTVSLGFAL